MLSVLVVSYASSLRAYLEQRDQVHQLDADIAQSRANIKELEREKERWRDKAFVQKQAREKFGFIMPGEIGYTVLDDDGEPLDRVDTLSDGRNATDVGRPEWYDAAWESVLLAGNPPDPDDQPKPAEEIKPPKQSGSDG